jgi:rhamnosyltransferase subunit B
MREAYEIVRERNRPGTVVVASSLMTGARMATEHLGMPLVTVDLQPSIILSAHSLPVSSSVNLPRWSPLIMRKLFLGVVGRFVTDPMLAPGINAFRAELGLPPVRDIFTKWLHSPDRTIALFPDWFGPPQPDWPPNTRTVGFILYDAQEGVVLPQDAERFLDAGEPPVVFTPGTAMQHGHAFFRAAAEASKMLGRRALFLTRHKEHLPSPMPEGSAHFDYLPFGRVFPRAAAIVHHGGIGTSAQALAAGVPQLLMPMAHDQPDNAARLVRIGVASKLSPREFTGAKVARALGEMLSSETLLSRCRSYALRIDSTKSAAVACYEIEQAGSHAQVS